MIAAYLLMGFGSCTQSVKSACVTHFPAFQEEVGGVLAALEPSRTTRAPAAVRPVSINDEKRNHWKSWSVTRLHDTQKYIDLANEEPKYKKIREALTVVANDLVSFYGYAHSGNQKAMARTLKSLQTRAEKARSLACAP
jgi:hypothetical protein